MRILKLGLLSVFFLFLVWTLLSLLIPSSVRISKATEVRFHWEERSDSLARVTLTHPGVRDLHNSFQLHRFEGADSLTLQWYIDFKLKWYPWEKFSSLFFENSYGNMMQTGLERMKVEAHKE
ncbi:MAG: hypothetical protein EOO15_03290 [Chitinophagaceae bacterium]|nr:MAG: hypothetical protein EOO15_03290 [Chitinophagaceae bacterium]